MIYIVRRTPKGRANKGALNSIIVYVEADTPQQAKKAALEFPEIATPDSNYSAITAYPLPLNSVQYL